MNKLPLFFIAVIFGLQNAHAVEKTDEQMKQAVEEVQKKLGMTFTGIKPEFIGPSPVAGLYEIKIGTKLIYYAPKPDLLLFGEFYSKDGISQTQMRISELQKTTVDQLPLDKAIKIGNGPNKVIEFTDLDCPYCKAWQEYASTRNDMTRYVFLMPVDSLHPTARAKSVHSLCSDNPGETVEKYLLGRLGTDRLIQCEEGKKTLETHESAARLLEVTGTPTLVINGTLVAGFNRPKIVNLLSKKENTK